MPHFIDPVYGARASFGFHDHNGLLPQYDDFREVKPAGWTAEAAHAAAQAKANETNLPVVEAPDGFGAICTKFLNTYMPEGSRPIEGASRPEMK
ncbi:hypothetical protein HYW54_05250 [Candidatus Gottesmanbacteria bacterium]|nr:hypothetical protein [Candidatus Gottesmanbacteria bacterium]